MKATKFFIFVIILKGSRGVRIQGVEVPGEVQAGEDVSLRCRVDPWPGPLYSLSWWKDGAQFYRAAVTAFPAGRNDTPSSGSLATVFPQPGLSVKVGGRGLGHVVLQAVTVAASGLYSCEAVADFPSFSQHLVSANLTVVDPPDTRPVVSGFRVRYRPGDQLTANCTVLRAHPLPTLTWFINSKKIVNGSQKVVEVVPEEDLTSTLTGRVSIRLQHSHFVDATFNLTCGARVGAALWTATTITGHLARGSLQTYLGVGGDTRGDHSQPFQSLHAGQAAVEGCGRLSLLLPLLPLLVGAAARRVTCREAGRRLLY
ncbi:uncharacterized protein LOC127000092 [Eriocheir sinensis]|uniref:uncharacterized protein LOC127000092 n=1 Tax=Eriocheir sinensis TaxID=95602 RepID=UPI0021C88902|nr:uncharacterized protein LOC127000092 [Eriocheir sinensis]